MNNVKPYTALIPASVAWFPPHTNVIGVTGAPKDSSSPNKPWRDNAFFYGTQWWQPPPTDMTYKVLADDLTPIGSPKFFATYTSSSIVATYREFAFMFPDGVPYLVDMIVPAQYAKTMNFGGSEPGFNKYPIDMGRLSDTLLLPPSYTPAGQEPMVQCINYQDFIRQAKPQGLTYEQMIAVVGNILHSGLSAEYMVQQIRLAVQNSPKPDPLI